jgi:hypothetical protein
MFTTGSNTRGHVLEIISKLNGALKFYNIVKNSKLMKKKLELAFKE